MLYLYVAVDAVAVRFWASDGRQGAEPVAAPGALARVLALFPGASVEVHAA